MIDNQNRLLVIEDEDSIAKHMSPKLGDCIRSAELARRATVTKPWRTISIDLNTPSASGLFGTEFSIQIGSQPLPLIRKIFYTGFRTTDAALIAAHLGGQHDFWVIGKSARNEVSFPSRTAIASPLGWIALIRHLLGQPQPDGPLRQEAQQFLDKLQKAKPTATEPWHRAYWRIAPKHLPQPLAEAAARYAASIAHQNTAAAGEVAVDRNGLLALNDFREWTLWLAAAQTAVILRQSRPLQRVPNRDGNGPLAARDWLTQQLRPIHALAPEIPGALAWRNYLGITEQPGLSSRGSVWHCTALDAMEHLRGFRNQAVHGLKRHTFAETDLSLPAMMDLASHWANNPLLSEVRREQGRWRAKAMCGPDWIDRDLPEDLEDRPVEVGHVYQLVWCFPNGAPDTQAPPDHLGPPKPALLDWWPYLRWELNRETGQRECVLLTQPKDSHDDSRWHAQGFSGTARLLTLSTPERAALTRSVG